MAGPLYIAVDLGAGSGRVFVVGVDPGELLLEETHRFQYPPIEESGHLRWDFGRILAETKHGLWKAGVRARELGRSVRSIGIDSWAVDYGLLDANGELIANPICYRDRRTKGAMKRVFAKVPRSEIFERTGIQFLNFNTLLQLYSEGGDLEKAERLLLLPDLMNFFLTGKTVAEYTNATTTQMLNAATGDWDFDLLERLDLPSQILPGTIHAGTDLGFLKSKTANELSLPDVRVTAVATHDTASAVAGAPLSQNWAYLSSGTWSLIGVENDSATINDEVAYHNFTNEGGVYGTIRFLKNVMGLWIFESCRKEWKARGIDVEYDSILREVEAAEDFKTFIFPDDDRLLNPLNMIEMIGQQLLETDQKFNETPAAISKIIFDSLAFRYASVLRRIESLTSQELKGVQILGGGGRNRYLNQMTANASGLPIRVGLTEATVVGNVLVQAISAGRFSSLSEARKHVAENLEFEEFSPQRSVDLDEAKSRYAAIEARFISDL
ncbi:MAG TPA: rhamnulokinase family protein [Pyrinomonadaceae bacterium]|nr:rhamnulokinase family protein [Pyrinomonadaceae bacterium]